jgi:elongation factor P
MKILFRGEPYMVLDYAHVKPGKGGAFVRTKMKHLLTGLTHEETFRSGEKFERPDLEYREMQYLYKDADLYNFMDQNNFEQAAFSLSQLSGISEYLKEQEVYTLMYFNNKAVAAIPPMFMSLTVAETQPGVRGDTAQGGATKPATLESGLVVHVPLFVNEGDIIKVDTRTNEYIERVK